MKKGRIWAYVRDQRPWTGAAPPGAVYYFAPDWKEDHVRHHLRQTSGILQGEEDQQTVRGTVCPTNGYKGYAKLYDPGVDGRSRFREAACWAHLRRVRLLSRTGRVRRLTPRRLDLDEVRDRL